VSTSDAGRGAHAHLVISSGLALRAAKGGGT
jgi:hypothetical protein